MLFQEEIKWKQRSGNKWLEARDCNTKFFHVVASVRLWESNVHRETKVVRFYQKLYTGDSSQRPRMDGIPFKKISPPKASIIEAPFSIIGLGGDRAPGPDGFPITFFQYFWHPFEEDFQMFFNEFLANGVMPEEFDASFIVLIPNKDGSVFIKDLRPKVLLDKILAKVLANCVLANCLRQVLPDIISDIQRNFVDGH